MLNASGIQCLVRMWPLVGFRAPTTIEVADDRAGVTRAPSAVGSHPVCAGGQGRLAGIGDETLSESGETFLVAMEGFEPGYFSTPTI